MSLEIWRMEATSASCAEAMLLTLCPMPDRSSARPSIPVTRADRVPPDRSRSVASMLSIRLRVAFATNHPGAESYRQLARELISRGGAP